MLEAFPSGVHEDLERAEGEALSLHGDIEQADLAQDVLHALQQDPNWSSVGVEWCGVCARGLLLCRRISPCLRPSLKDVRNYDTPIRE